MSINREQVSNTATLARLQVSDAEVDEVTRRIGAILDLVDQMQAVDTTGVEPMANPLDAVQLLRADALNEPEDKVAERDRLQKNAPATEDGLFLVPKVID